MSQPLGRFTEDEISFIRDVLDEHGDYLCELLQEAVENKELIVTGDLENTIKAHVNPNSGLNPRLSVEFNTYGRFIELRYFRKTKNSEKLASPNTNQIVWGIRNTPAKLSRNRKKDTRFYSRNVYGSLNRLIGILSYEYGDWVIAKEKAGFQFANKTISI